MIPDITALWVIGFLLTCTFLLNTLIFQPILKVIEARGKAVADARQMAQTAADRANVATTEYTRSSTLRAATCIDRWTRTAAWRSNLAPRCSARPAPSSSASWGTPRVA